MLDACASSGLAEAKGLAFIDGDGVPAKRAPLVRGDGVVLMRVDDAAGKRGYGEGRTAGGWVADVNVFVAPLVGEVIPVGIGDEDVVPIETRANPAADERACDAVSSGARAGPGTATNADRGVGGRVTVTDRRGTIGLEDHRVVVHAVLAEIDAREGSTTCRNHSIDALVCLGISVVVRHAQLVNVQDAYFKSSLSKWSRRQKQRKIAVRSL